MILQIQRAVEAGADGAADSVGAVEAVADGAADSAGVVVDGAGQPANIDTEAVKAIVKLNDTIFFVSIIMLFSF